MPGAVPVGFGKKSAPTGIKACLLLLGGISRPKIVNLASISAKISLSSLRGVWKKSAIVSVVKSSGVGPSPPVKIKIEERSRAIVNIGR